MNQKQFQGRPNNHLLKYQEIEKLWLFSSFTDPVSALLFQKINCLTKELSEFIEITHEK
jgi:hypothetical protein